MGRGFRPVSEGKVTPTFLLFLLAVASPVPDDISFDPTYSAGTDYSNT